MPPESSSFALLEPRGNRFGDRCISTMTDGRLIDRQLLFLATGRTKLSVSWQFSFVVKAEAVRRLLSV